MIESDIGSECQQWPSLHKSVFFNNKISFMFDLYLMVNKMHRKWVEYQLVTLCWHWANKSLLYPILIMPSARLGSNKYQSKSHYFDLTRVRISRVWIRTHKVRIPRSPIMGDGCSTHLATLSGIHIYIYNRVMGDCQHVNKVQPYNLIKCWQLWTAPKYRSFSSKNQHTKLVI